MAVYGSVLCVYYVCVHDPYMAIDFRSLPSFDCSLYECSSFHPFWYVFVWLCMAEYGCVYVPTIETICL